MALFITRRLCNLFVIFIIFFDGNLTNVFLLANAVDIDVSSIGACISDSCINNNYDLNKETFETYSRQQLQDSRNNIRGDDQSGSLFYAWPQNELTNGEDISLLAMLFPDLQALENAWETHPLLSKVSFDAFNDVSIFEAEIEQAGMMTTQEVISTTFHNRSNVLAAAISLLRDVDKSNKMSKKNTVEDIETERYVDPILSLMTVDDIATILMQPSLHQQSQQPQPMIQGQDYKLVKKVLLPDPYPTNPSMAGQEYMGMLSKPHYDIQDILHYFHYGGFSLVLDGLQNRWIGNNDLGRLGVAGKGGMARQLEHVLGAILVGVNVYLTPEALPDDDSVGSDDIDACGNSRSNKNGDKSAKMEKKVRQGFEAHWDWMDVIVIQLSGRKRWSIAREPTIYLSNKDQKRKPTQEEVQHNIHSAKYRDVTLCPGDVLYIPRGFIHNASTVDFDDFEAGSNGGVEKWDVCPAYPSESHSNSDGNEREIMMRQLLAGRLHGPSLHVTFGIEQSCEGTIESLLHHALHSYFSTSGEEESVAIHAQSCKSQRLSQSRYDVTWKSVLHHTFAEIARRKHPCDNPSFHDTSNVTCNGSVTLRRSMPLSLLSLNEFGVDEVEGGVSNPQYAALRRTFLTALEVVASLFDIHKTAKFIASHLLQPHSEGESTFCFPGYSDRDVIHCPKKLLELSESMLSEYRNVVEKFLDYARINFDEALIRMNTHGKKMRRVDHDRQDLNLKFVGQGF
mmetsp:Transcript_14101/g.29648  ORF Transcript_14101/g.29648 Transcript_14101/m.29648 type:complete len:736 (-) Transcript_14101:124-2331(-)